METSTLQWPRQAIPAPHRINWFLGIPWYLYTVLFCSTSIIIGLVWDVSWHMSIGRDTLWSPPHLATYLGGVGAGLASGYQVFKTTFWGILAEKQKSVTIWSFKGPLGGWFCIWGALAMLTSAPFDDWWHNTYGLDVEILSPPHVVLIVGMITIQLGALLFIVPEQNKSKAAEDALAGRRLRRLGYMYAYATAILLAMMHVTLTEYIEPNNQHSATFYKVVSSVFPLFLVASSRSSVLRWPATITAFLYMLILLELSWILQLFPAEPKLAPIRNPITHMVPLGFPLLLIFPAMGLDWIKQRWHHQNGWLQSVLYGAIFLTILVPVQWFFSLFLLAPASRNFIFMGGAVVPFFSRADNPNRFLFHNLQTPAELLTGLAFALVLGILFSYMGLAWGNWMRRVKR